jgi:hypothetical protein
MIQMNIYLFASSIGKIIFLPSSYILKWVSCSSAALGALCDLKWVSVQLLVKVVACYVLFMH